MLNLIDENFNLHARRIPAQSTGMTVTEFAGLTCVDSGISCDTFNIIHITDGVGMTEQALLGAIDHFRNKKFAFCIWVSRENLSGKVAAILRKSSVQQKNYEPGMVLDLSTYQITPDSRHKNIIVADTVIGVQDFAEVVASNWTPPDVHVITFFRSTAHKYLDRSNNVQLAIYYEGNIPVAVIEMFGSDDETVGLYSLATLSDYRGKGIGTVMMRYALNKVKREGFKRVILQASESGLGIYQKYGFSQKTTYFEFG